MGYFANVTTATELKTTYRKLALKFHPDRGGNMWIMQRINDEYSKLAETFKPQTQSLIDVKTGDTVFVNDTECEVIYDRCKITLISFRMFFRSIFSISLLF